MLGKCKLGYPVGIRFQCTTAMVLIKIFFKLFTSSSLKIAMGFAKPGFLKNKKKKLICSVRSAMAYWSWIVCINPNINTYMKKKKKNIRSIVKLNCNYILYRSRFV